MIYRSHFPLVPMIKKEVLLEVGFDRTAPNEPRDFSSWALDKTRELKLEVTDNRALGIRCFNPEYTFVDKLQTICRRFRQHRDRNHRQTDRPQNCLRHYYDLYMLLGTPRVQAFIGTDDYEAYKKLKLKTTDAAEFASRDAFMLGKAATYALFEKEFAVMNAMITPPRPRFPDMIARIREHSTRL